MGKYFLKIPKVEVPGISEEVTKRVQELSMSLIVKAEDLLGTVNYSSVDNIPDNYEEVDDINIAIKQELSQPGIFYNPTLETEAGSIISKIKEYLSVSRSNMASATKYYGKISGYGSNTFYPKVIRYKDNEPFYDIKVTDLPDNPRMISLKIKLRKIF